MLHPLQKKIGIIGGGQLGKMMILEAKKMGFWVAVLDPASDCPCAEICDKLIVSGFDDKNAIESLSRLCDVITYEFEHINADALIELEKNSGITVYPAPSSLKLIQNKFIQKSILHKNGVPVPEFMEVSTVEALHKAGESFGYPFILKTALGGYDGKGNFVINAPEEIIVGYNALGGGSRPLMAEKMVDFLMEISVLACRGADGEVKVFPVGKNTHIDNILEETVVPAPISSSVSLSAMAIASQVMDIFEGVGIFCIEMFVDRNDSILVNEIAPRPHNSGHYTIEACVTDQFEQHIRAVAGLPLGDTQLLRPAAMRNILGGEGYSGKPIVTGVEAALTVKGSKLHIYGKATTKPGRKMGHITVTADTAEEASKLCALAKKCVMIKA